MSQLIEFMINRWELFVALLIILMLMYGGGVMRRIRGYREIAPRDAVLLLNHDDSVVLDVREDSEVKQGHIINAIHIPLGKLDERMAELESFKQRAVVVSCRSGHRSASACARLRKQGFEQVYNLKGGVMAWESSGLPLYKPGKTKKRKEK